MELRYWLVLGNVKKQQKLVEWKAFVDTVRIKSADLKTKFMFQSFAAFRACLMYREKPQTAICCLEWLGRFKCLATGLDAFSFVFLYVVKVFSESLS